MDTRLNLQLQANRRRRVPAASLRPSLVAEAAALAAVIAVGILVLVLDGHDVSWLAGLLAGGGAAATLALRPRHEFSGARSVTAGRAEGRTAAAVRALERAGWRFVHDVPGPDGPYDHIAVGPGGLILLESLSPEGVVNISAGQPVVDVRGEDGAPPRRHRLRPQALADAITIRERVQRIAGRRLWVQAVVVLWSEFPAGCVADGRCVYVHGSRLAEWMARRPHQLDEVEADEVFAAVAQMAEQAGDGLLPIAV